MEPNAKSTHTPVQSTTCGDTAATQPPQPRPPHPSRRSLRHHNLSHSSPLSHRSMWEQSVAQHLSLEIIFARCATQVLLCRATTGVLIQKIVAGTAVAHGVQTVRRKHTACTRMWNDPPEVCLRPSSFRYAAFQAREPLSCSWGSLRLLGSVLDERINLKAIGTFSKAESP